MSDSFPHRSSRTTTTRRTLTTLRGFTGTRRLTEDKNLDCFYIAVARHFNRNTTSRQELLDYACQNFNGVKKTGKPVGLKDIATFERLNQNMAVSVIFLDEKNKPLPVRASTRVDVEHHVVLLLTYVNPSEDDPNRRISTRNTEDYLHYICIEDPSDFLVKRLSNSPLRNYKRRKHICFNCFNGFREETLQKHISWCHQAQNQRILYPKKEDDVKFKAGYKASMVPFIIFYDFESLQKSISRPCSCSNDVIDYTNADNETRMAMEHDKMLRESWEHVRVPKLRICLHKTKVIHTQVPFAYHIIAMSREGEVIETREYMGEEAASKFCDDMLDLDEILMRRMENVVPMKLTKEQEAFEDAKICYLCEKELEDDNVRDHDHLSGKYLGAAHNMCNLRRRELKKIVAFSHNFSGYDSHLFIRELSKKTKRLHHCHTLPINSQKVRTLEMNNTNSMQ